MTIDQHEQLDEILEDESGQMTPFEVNFSDSVDKQRQRGEFVLSIAQDKTLNQIWDKLFS